MTAHLAPVLRVADGTAAVTWYEQLGFVKEWEHRFEPGLPLYVAIALGDAQLHLSDTPVTRNAEPSCTCT